jgi:hypothetical protein
VDEKCLFLFGNPLDNGFTEAGISTGQKKIFLVSYVVV